MSVPASSAAIFTRILRLRSWIAAGFLALTAAGIYGALRIPDDLAIEHLMVPGDPAARATRDFEQHFPEGEQALLVLETPDPLSPDAVGAASALERELARIPGVEPHSLLTLYRLAVPGAQVGGPQAARLRSFATGTAMFRRAGLLGDHYLGIALELRVHSPAERDRALAAIEARLAPLAARGSAFTAVGRVGSPWLDAWLERQTGLATKRFMPLFGLFLMALVLIVYRSWRTLAAMILTLATVVAVAMGLADLVGFTHTVVSALVPLTIMVTTTATLVYIHSRYLDADDAMTPLEHHARALADKFLPCSASILATAVGFAALAVSDIRPVREMGLWTAGGLLVAWIASFSLFPALQSLLRVPRRAARAPALAWFEGFADWLVPFTRRWRWALVAAALVLMSCGAAALFGIPGRIAPLPLETDALSYVNPNERVAQDTRRFRQLSGLDVVELWLQTTPGQALDPEFLRAVEELGERLERDPRITAVDGPTSALRWAHYVQSGSDQLPAAPADWPKLAADLEQILLTEPGARGYVDLGDLASVRLSVRGRGELFGPGSAMRAYIEQTVRAMQAAEPALRGVRIQAVGKGVLAAQMSEHLVPTLTESFVLTASVIFVAFLFVFRSPAGRLMAMIPSLFAILTVFLVMRATGIPLNIATILIGSTVLGATENDQIHFFYHYQQGRAGGGSTAAALRRALLVAGRPILFATVINASGFLALALSDLPPMRQFGIVTSTAFVLALLADFTALPGALWILSRPAGSARAADS